MTPAALTIEQLPPGPADDPTHVRFVVVGALTEDFRGPVLPTDTRAIRLDLRGVTRVNSGGVRSWIQWLDSLPHHVERAFEACSFAITQQATTIANFLQGTLLGYFVPYFCDTCSHEMMTLIEAPQPPPASRVCATCGAEATSEIPVETLLALYDQPGTLLRAR